MIPFMSSLQNLFQHTMHNQTQIQRKIECGKYRDFPNAWQKSKSRKYSRKNHVSSSQHNFSKRSVFILILLCEIYGKIKDMNHVIHVYNSINSGLYPLEMLPSCRRVLGDESIHFFFYVCFIFALLANANSWQTYVVK